MWDVTIHIQTAWRHNADACCHNRSRLATALSSTPLPCHVPLNGIVHQDTAKQWNKLRITKTCDYDKLIVLNSSDKSHLCSICTQYVGDKSENALVCAKRQWNAIDWCYWIALPALPVMQPSNTVSCVSLSFWTYPCVLAIYPHDLQRNQLRALSQPVCGTNLWIIHLVPFELIYHPHKWWATKGGWQVTVGRWWVASTWNHDFPDPSDIRTWLISYPLQQSLFLWHSYLLDLYKWVHILLYFSYNKNGDMHMLQKINWCPTHTTYHVTIIMQ